MDVAALVVEVTSFALQCSECTESRYTGGVVQLARLAPHQLAGEGPVLAELQPGVEREHASEAAIQLAVGPEEPDGRLFPQLALHAQRADPGATAGQGVRRRHAAGLPVVDGDRAQGPAPGLPAQPQAGAGVHNATREEQVHRRLEIARVLDEERSLLGEEHLEALVDGHLRIIGLDLAEVRVDSCVEGQGVAHHQLGVHS